MDKRMKILIGYDGSKCADAAIDDLKKAGLPTTAQVLLITTAEVWLPPPSIFADEKGEVPFPLTVPVGVKRARVRAARAIEEAKEVVAQAAAHVQSLFPEWEVRSYTTSGSPAWEIISKADDIKPDLIVLGSHGRGAVGRLILGSVSQKVLTEANCSVRIARSRTHELATAYDEVPLRLVVGLDGSLGAEQVVETIAQREWPSETSVLLVTATEPFYMYGIEPGALQSHAEDIQRSATHTLGAIGLHISSVVREGDPKQILLEEAENWGADSIFVGAKGHRFFERVLLGSVSYAVAARAHCSVEVIR